VWAGTYSFVAPNLITINDATIATPYPSGIFVSGIPANEKIDKITVTFHRLSHNYSGDIDVLLAAPSGTNLILFSDVGGGPALSGPTITLDDEATATLSFFGLIESGVFKPTNYGVPNDPFPPPAPPPSSATNLSIFKGTNPNGVWSLYVVDDAPSAMGSIAGGWSMTIRTTALFTNSNVITINDSATPPTKASPYPSSIMVSNLIGNVIKVTATLKGFAHYYPDDVDILLVGPPVISFFNTNLIFIYPNLILMSDAGGGTIVTNLTFTFDDSAGVQLPDAGRLTNGTFLPSDFVGLGSDTFPSPAPILSAATDLSIFNGKNPNGRWDLFVVDDQFAADGQIANGWSLSIVTEIPAPVIINPRVVSGIFQFTWFALQGVFYQVDSTVDLSSPSWTPRNTIFGSNSLQTVGFPISSSSAQFFRVRATQPLN
ncbi:MAG: hypothetical protein ACR2H1_08315, partial [Limisphaerales bacterium]